MKVICVDNKNNKGIVNPNLIIGKEYEMETIIKTFDYGDDQYEYYIINNMTYWSKSGFITLEEYRDKRLKEIGI
jgi:hypothetical protein